MTIVLTRKEGNASTRTNVRKTLAASLGSASTGFLLVSLVLGSLVFFMVCINRFSIVVVIIIKLIYASVFMIIINFVINAVLINLVFISIIISDHRPDNFPAPGVTSACVSPDISFLRAAASEDHDDDHHVCSCSRP